jgi:hypothetical protein
MLAAEEVLSQNFCPLVSLAASDFSSENVKTWLPGFINTFDSSLNLLSRQRILEEIGSLTIKMNIVQTICPPKSLSEHTTE